jgi:endo-1,4-beta-D-glucanase Y
MLPFTKLHANSITWVSITLAACSLRCSSQPVDRTSPPAEAHGGGGGVAFAGQSNGGTGSGSATTDGGGAGTVSPGGAGSDGAGASAGASGGTGPDPTNTVSLTGLGACRGPAAAKFADVESAYAKFKLDLLTSDGAGGYLRVRRPNSAGAIDTTNSEGIGYGMLIAVYMNEPMAFDQLWKYEQQNLDARGLMNWEINPAGTGPTAQGAGAASDGDEDMAFALVMADKKWGGSGSLNDTYLNSAKKQIDLIWQYEVDHTLGDVLIPGDQFGGGQVINISYFAPAYYRVFGEVTGKTAEWTRVVDASYQALSAALNAANGNLENGLVPAWSTPGGTPMAPSGTSHPTNHQLDSSRTPFRIGQDYCWFNEPRALAYLQKISQFYGAVGAANIVDGYELGGTPSSGASLHLAAFVGPAGVGAMGTTQATLLGQSYAALVTPPGLLGGSLYYNESWSVLSLLMLNGRMLNLAN